MKLLIVGNDSVFSIENYYQKHLAKAGVKVSMFACHEYYSDGSLLTRVLNKIGIPWVYYSVNRALVSKCKRECPDIVWVFKGVEIFTSTLLELKKLGIFLVNYNPDHPFIRTTTGHGNDSIAKAVSLYDMHFCYNRILRKVIEDEYRIPSYILPFAFEYSPVLDEKTDEPEIRRVCMVGNADQKRADNIQKLLDNGVPVDVYGNRWKRYLKKNGECRIFEAIHEDRFWRVLRQYRVQLNIFRPHNEGSHNMRTFEIPACGGIQLAPYSKEHAEFFTEGKDIFMYHNAGEMVRKAKYLLSLDSEAASELKENARKTSFSRQYTYQNRAQFVLETFQKHINNPL